GGLARDARRRPRPLPGPPQRDRLPLGRHRGDDQRHRRHRRLLAHAAPPAQARGRGSLAMSHAVAAQTLMLAWRPLLDPLPLGGAVWWLTVVPLALGIAV